MQPEANSFGTTSHFIEYSPQPQQTGASAMRDPDRGPSRHVSARDARDLAVTLGIPCRLEAQSLEWMLHSHGQIRHVQSHGTLDELVDHINSECPRVLLLDECFSGSDLLVIGRQLPVRLKECRIGLFADRLSSRQLQLAAGHVHGMLSRHCNIQILLSELENLAAGRLVISRGLQNRVQIDRDKSFNVTMIGKVERLTDRQLEVLIRIASGMSAKETARELHITEKAVESHKYRLMRSLNLGNRLELCRWAIREGIISA